MKELRTGREKKKTFPKASYLRIQGPSVQGFLLFMAKNKARFLFKTQWKSAILKHWWESRRGLLHYWPSSLVRKMLIIHIQAFSKRRVRCERSDRGEAVRVKSHRRCLTGGSDDEPRWQVYFSYCATCLWSERGVSAKVALVRAQRVWRTVSESSVERVDGGDEEISHHSLGGGVQNKLTGMQIRIISSLSFP